MARIGIKTVYEPLVLDNARVTALFEHLRTAILAAGFSIIENSASVIEFVAAGRVASLSDEEPHWAFVLAPYGTGIQLIAEAIHGFSRSHENAHVSPYSLFSPDDFYTPPPEITCRFCADGVQGWWWFSSIPTAPDDQQIYMYTLHVAGVTSRRYPADLYQGACARYGIWSHRSEWRPAYARRFDGSYAPMPGLSVWSVLGAGWSNTGVRQPDMPRMAVSMFPSPVGRMATVILGEFNEVLAVTDGYATEEVLVPGWIVIAGDGVTFGSHAVPAPEQFQSV